LISVTPLEKTVDVSFLKYMLSHLIPTGEGTSIPQLTVPGLKPFLIALPPYHEQLKIVQSIKSYLKLIDEIDNNQLELNNITVQLKQKVLDVAMQGKLVPQDPNDEPASVLLEKIRAEKLKLFEEGKLKKKDLVETEIVKGDDNAYYEKFPDSWIFQSLSQVTLNLDSKRKAINSTERARRIEKASNSHLYPYYGATGETGKIDDYLLDETTILVGEDGAPFLDKYAIKAYKVSGKYWVNNHAHILRALIEEDFLLNYLNYFDYTGYVNGTTRLKLTQTSLQSIPIIVPPVEEQRRIVSELKRIYQSIEDIFQSGGRFVPVPQLGAKQSEF